MHIPVLFNEVISVLDPKEGEVFVDGTFGTGGHAEGIIRRIGTSGTFIGIDVDPEAVALGKKKFEKEKNSLIVCGNYADIESILNENGIERIDGLLLDLGFSSVQIDDPLRGFSFRYPDAPLDMNYGMRKERAESIVNKWSEKSLLSIFKKFGEERYAGRIARRIVKERKQRPIRTVGDLVALIERVVPSRRGKKASIHPATRVFQALRIAVNDELENIETILEILPKIMNPGGRVAIISFHSLEDRVVKTHFRALVAMGIAELITKKPIVPDIEEIKKNPRSRSAKLRAITFKNIKI